MDLAASDSVHPQALGERLAAARKVRRMTQEEVARELGLHRSTIIEIEKGNRPVKPLELLTMARLYGCDVRELLRLVRAGSPSFAVQFRLGAGASGDAPVERQEDVRRFERWCRNYADLERMTGTPMPREYPKPYDISATSPRDAGAEVAVRERERLGLGSAPIGDLEDLLESWVGLRVVVMPMLDASIAGMFVFDQEYGGCIALNAAQRLSRRRWTLAHEYAHFLTDRAQAEITGASNRAAREQFADAFAAGFLLPEAGLTPHFRAIKRAKPDHEVTAYDVLGLAAAFGASFQATMLRLERLGLMPKGSYDQATLNGFQPERGAGDGRGVTPAGHWQFPGRFVRLAAQAYEAAEISGGELAAMLETDRVSALAMIGEVWNEYGSGDAALLAEAS